MRKYTVLITDDVEDYYVELMRFVASKYSLEAAIRYVKRIREDVEVLSHLAPMLPKSKYEFPKLYHPEAKTYVVGKKKLTAIFHIEGEYVIVDKILPSSLIKY